MGMMLGSSMNNNCCATAVYYEPSLISKVFMSLIIFGCVISLLSVMIMVYFMITEKDDNISIKSLMSGMVIMVLSSVMYGFYGLISLFI